MRKLHHLGVFFLLDLRAFGVKNTPGKKYSCNCRATIIHRSAKFQWPILLTEDLSRNLDLSQHFINAGSQPGVALIVTGGVLSCLFLYDAKNGRYLLFHCKAPCVWSVRWNITPATRSKGFKISVRILTTIIQLQIQSIGLPVVIDPAINFIEELCMVNYQSFDSICDCIQEPCASFFFTSFCFPKKCSSISSP